MAENRVLTKRKQKLSEPFFGHDALACLHTCKGRLRAAWSRISADYVGRLLCLIALDAAGRRQQDEPTPCGGGKRVRKTRHIMAPSKHRKCKIHQSVNENGVEVFNDAPC